MAEVDTSSYPKPQPAQNPLDQIMKVGQTADVLGQLEVGKGLQQAIQPDGTIDRNVLAQVLKGSVAGSMQAPKALNALETLRQAGYAADQQGIESIRNQMGFSSQLLAPFMKLDPNKPDKPDGITQSQMIDNWGKMIKHANEYGIHGIVQMAASSLAATQKMTPQQRLKAVQNAYLQGQQNQQVFEASLPQQVPYQTGARSGTTVAGTRLAPQGVSVATEPGPTQATVDTRRTLPNGQPNPNYGQPMIIGAGTSAPPPITRTDASGRVIPPVKQVTDNITGYQGMPTSGGQPVRLAQPGDGTMLGRPGPMATGLPPGEMAPMEASSAAYAKDLADSRTYAERMNPLKQAIPLVEKLGKSGTGPGQETVQHMKAFAQTFGIPTINQDTVKTYAELKKYLSQNAAAVAPPGTNIPSVLNAFEANPNVQQPQQAVVELSKMLYGLGRMRQASVLAFQKTGLPANQYTEWAAQWSPKQDIRGYIADLMTPQQRKDLLGKVKKGSSQAAKISDSYKTAKDLDLLGDVERP